MTNLINAERPIGVFDSGIGGLNVLCKLEEIMPKENFVYYGDNSNAPYGNKSVTELKKLALSSVDKLLANSVKMIVIACNTLSCQVYDYVKMISPVEVVKTTPSNKVLSGKTNPAIICTPKCADSDYIKNNFKCFKVVPLPFLAGEIERNLLTPSKISIEKDLNALDENTDYLVLGCTHYVYMKQKIENLLGIPVHENCMEVACLAKAHLSGANLLVQKNKKPTTTFVGKSANYNFKVYKQAFVPKKTRKVVKIP